MSNPNLARVNYRNVSRALKELTETVLVHGDEVASRGGSRTMELTNWSFTLTHPAERYLMVEGRRASLPAQIAETMWVLAGRNDIGWLAEYLPRAYDFSDDGETWRGGYGPRLRAWPATSILGSHYAVDQLKHVIELLQADPTTRQAVISIYDPGRDTAPTKDVPCNNWLHFLSRKGRLDLHVTTRSNDLWWGWSGINAFEWSVLQELVASILGVQVGRLHFTIGSLHIYDKHWKRARELGAGHRPERPTPRTEIRSLADFDGLAGLWFDMERHLREEPWLDHTERILAMPDPLLRSWLHVLADWWTTTDTDYMSVLAGTPLEWASLSSPNRPNADRALTIQATELPVTTEAVNDRDAVMAAHPSSKPKTSFPAVTAALHAEKHAAYGDSWRKRGELFSILPNIGRKIDRLTIGGETPDETQVDTATDLAVYLIKYWLWLNDPEREPGDEADAVERALLDLDKRCAPGPWQTNQELAVEWFNNNYDRLLGLAERRKDGRADHVHTMMIVAYRQARHLWEQVCA